MKVCIVIDDYLPYSIRVGAKMMHELAIELKSRGHEITVITPRPEHCLEKILRNIIEDLYHCRRLPSPKY